MIKIKYDNNKQEFIIKREKELYLIYNNNKINEDIINRVTDLRAIVI